MSAMSTGPSFGGSQKEAREKDVAEQLVRQQSAQEPTVVGRNRTLARSEEERTIADLRERSGDHGVAPKYAVQTTYSKDVNQYRDTGIEPVNHVELNRGKTFAQALVYSLQHSPEVQKAFERADSQPSKVSQKLLDFADKNRPEKQAEIARPITAGGMG